MQLVVVQQLSKFFVLFFKSKYFKIILFYCSFRSISGECNNARYPTRGAYDTAFSRVLPSVYDDNIYSIRRSVTGKELPNPRKIAEKFYTDVSPLPPASGTVLGNVGSIIFSQSIVHDFAGQKLKQTEETGPGTRCCAPNRSINLQPELTSSACLPISVAKDDFFYSQHNVSCLNFMRSQTVNKYDCTFRPAEQTNIVTHYIDGSHIYGSTEALASELRTKTGGLLQMSDDDILPTTDAGGLRAGDGRALQTPQLAFYHSIYYREHNRIARQLAGLNPTWSDERLYQEARRVVIALIQHHTYDEFLPIFIGEAEAAANGLLCRDSVHCDCYSDTIDGSVINEFTTGPGRIFHFFVPDNLILQNAAGAVDLRRISTLFGQSGLIRTNYDDIIRGMLFQPMKTNGFPFELLNHMFRTGATEAGLDLLSMDIQRGRDHGLPPYLHFRTFCGLAAVTTFEALEPYLIPGVSIML